MLLTVAICTWNRAALLDRTLTALRRLRVPAGADWEVLVIDNACTDDTPAVVERHRPFLPVRRVDEPRPGIAFARNAGIRHARGEFVLWTDDDTLVEPDWAEKYLEAFDRFRADLVFGTILPDWEGGKPPAWYVPAFAGSFGVLDYGGQARVSHDPRYVGHNANLGFRRSLIDRLGGYREVVAVGRTGKGEDVDLSQRAYAAGLTVVYQPAAVVRHFIPLRTAAKANRRREAWAGAADHLTLLREEADRVPRLFGLPRYFVRMQLAHLGRWAGAMLRGRTGQAFYHEVKLLRLAALLYLSFTRPPRRPRPAHAPA